MQVQMQRQTQPMDAEVESPMQRTAEGMYRRTRFLYIASFQTKTRCEVLAIQQTSSTLRYLNLLLNNF